MTLICKEFTVFQLLKTWYSSMLTLINVERKLLDLKKQEILIALSKDILKRPRRRHWMCSDAIPKIWLSSLFALNHSMMQESAYSDLMAKWEYANLSLIFSKNALMIQYDSLSSEPWQLQVKEYQKITSQQ